MLWVALCTTTIGTTVTHAQVGSIGVVGSSPATMSTTPSARRSFFDSNAGIHWVYWHNGSAIEYASSSDGSTWTSRGTLPYDTTRFSVTHRVLSGASYVFLVVEADAHDIVLRRGTMNGTSVTFDAALTVFDGSSSSDRYLKPIVALDSSSHVWVAAVKNSGAAVVPPLQVFVRRTTSPGASVISFDASTAVGDGATSLQALSLVAQPTEAMVLVRSGDSDQNISAHRFDGTSWSEVTTGGESGWLSFKNQGFTGDVRAIAIDASGTIYIGGSFSKHGVDGLPSVLKWDGARWTMLGDGIEGDVEALALDASGSLYASGDFASAGGVATANIAKWDGSNWSALGDGLNGAPYALAIGPDGALYAGGVFTASGATPLDRLAKWNGSTWSALGAGVNDTVREIAVDANGLVYVGGDFTIAGGISASHVASWDGTSWSSLGSGITGGSASVSSLVIDQDNNVFVGGGFTSAGGVAANNVAKWNGSSWSLLGSGLNNAVGALAVDSSGAVYAGGAFTQSGATSVQYLAKWNGAAWSAVGADNQDLILSLKVDANDTLYVGGGFSRMGGIYANSLARFDGSEWSNVEGGFNGEVYIVQLDGTGRLYAGGAFTHIGGLEVNGIASWDGTTWSALGGGVNSSVRSVRVHQNGDVYVGGSFTMAGGISADRVARWNGSTWSAVGNGFNGDVTALAFDSINDLYAGGAFTSSGGLSVNRIAKWNGSSWSNLQTGLNGVVRAIAINASDEVFVGGDFTTAAGGSANRVAKWDGTSWFALDWDVDTGKVYALAIESGVVHAASAQSNDSNHVASWNGSEWSVLGGDFDIQVFDLEFDSSGKLYAGGSFTQANGVPAKRIAQWDGTSWSEVGGGVDATVNGIAVTSAGVVYLGRNDGVSRSHVVGVRDQRLGSDSSVVSDASGATYVLYIDSAGDLIAQSISGSPYSWGTKQTVHAGAVASAALSYRSSSGELLACYAEAGEIEYRTASSPYESGDWSSATTVSSTNQPMSVSAYEEGNSNGKVLISWNRATSSSREVAATIISVVTPTPTPAPKSAAKPKRPMVRWSSDPKTRKVFGVVTRVSGVRYSITGKKSSSTKRGVCKTNPKTKKFVCSIHLARGTWRVSITPRKNGVTGSARTKSFKFR